MTELDIKRKASELLQKGRLDEAVAEYQVLLDAMKKPNPAILNLIGDIHIKQGNLEMGFEKFLLAARQYNEEGLFHNAIAVGKKILRLDQDQTEVYGMLGHLYARQGLGMDCVKFLGEYARRKEVAGEYPAALAAFAEACETLADIPEVHLAYGEMLARVDRPEDAAACFEAAAMTCGDRGQVERAEEYRMRAVALRGGGLAAGDPESGRHDMSELMNLRTLEDDDSADTVAPPPSPGLTLSPGPASPPPTSKPSTPDLTLSTEPPEPGLTLSPEPAEPGLTLSSAASSAQEAKPDDVRDDFWGRGEEPDGLSSGESAGSNPWDVFAANDHPDLPLPPPLPPGSESTSESAPDPVFEALPADPLVDFGEEPEARIPDTGLEPAEDEDEDSSLCDLPGIIMPSSDSIAGPVAGSSADPQDASDLTEFFDQAARDSSEQAVIIGDDFELVREGGDVNEVIADFREATMEILDLDDHQAHYDLGTTYMERELFDEAAAEFEIAARGETFALPAREMLGYCFLRKGQIDLAIRELENGLAIPGYDERDKLGLLYNLGIACGVLDQEERAIQYFQKILELDPDFRDAQERLERLVQNSI